MCVCAVCMCVVSGGKVKHTWKVAYDVTVVHLLSKPPDISHRITLVKEGEHEDVSLNICNFSKSKISIQIHVFFKQMSKDARIFC